MNAAKRFGFTLIEVLVSTTIVVVLTMLLISVADQTGSMWSRSRAKVEQFREARTGFETMTQRLSQATLNTYWDYNDPVLPTSYQRRSELRFVSGHADELLGPDGDDERITHCVFFHAPLGLAETTAKRDPLPGDKAAEGLQGLENLLNCWGYFVQFGGDREYRPSFLNELNVPVRWRFRLVEFALPSEKLATYNLTSGGQKAYTFKDDSWFVLPLGSSEKGTHGDAVHVLAENIIALVITPRLSKNEEAEIAVGTTGSPLAPDYRYDSAPPTPEMKQADSRYRDGRLNPVNQLPPVVQVTMVAIDEDSAIRLNLAKGSADVLGVSQRFRNSSNYDQDLRLSKDGGTTDSSLESELIQKRINYRIFTSNVPIRAAKWSRAQAEQ